MAATVTHQRLRAASAAAYLGKSPKTLRNWRAAGVGPDYSGEGHGVVYDTRDLDAWLESRKTRHTVTRK